MVLALSRCDRRQPSSEISSLSPLEPNGNKSEAGRQQCQCTLMHRGDIDRFGRCPGRSTSGSPAGVRHGSIPFSNGSRSGCSILSGMIPSGACVLYVLIRHLMGSAGCRVAWLKPQWAEISAACYRIGAIICSLPRASLPLGSSLRSPVLV
jgi:hypothetical protein